MHNIIISKSFKYKLQNLKKLSNNIKYDSNLGYWILLTENKPYMLSNIFQKPMTKKHDIETGEDHKGE